ncbi:tRNA methyltransferase 1 [Balamuthia mandrillaris]
MQRRRSSGYLLSSRNPFAPPAPCVSLCRSSSSLPRRAYLWFPLSTRRVGSFSCSSSSSFACKHSILSPQPPFAKKMEAGPSSSAAAAFSTTNQRQGGLTPPEGYEALTEGQATIIFASRKDVFYNQVQEFNRDLSILIIKLFIEEMKKKRGARFDGVTILEALSATGLRSIRFWKELKDVKYIMANDISEAAVESIRRNVEFNGITTSQVIPNLGDATMVMYEHRDHGKQFDVIDLDPYGSAAIFMDGAVQSVSDGGLLCVTCTDLMVLCGNYPEVCFYKYGGFPIKGKATHEHAVRLVLASLERSANRYKRYIKPLVAMQVDFYVRVFVRVFTQADEVKNSCTKLSHIYQCTGCGSLHHQPLGNMSQRGKAKHYSANGPSVGSSCDECGRPFKMVGPIWNGPLCDPDFIQNAMETLDASRELFTTHKKIYGLLSVLSQEVPDQPLFHDLTQLAKVLHMQLPPMAMFRSAILNLNRGYRVSISHTNSSAIKTDAPCSVLWEVVRAYAKLHPVKRVAPDSPAAAILAKEPTLEIDFTIRPEAKTIKSDKGPRFVTNPPNWGPGTRNTINAKRRAPEPSEEAEEEEEEEGKERGDKKRTKPSDADPDDQPPQQQPPQK